MTKKATDIVAYLSVIGWLIAYFAGDKENSKFHLNQGLVLAIAEIIVEFVSPIPIVNIAAGICGVILFVVWLVAFIGACNGEEKPMPILGGIKILK